MDSAGKLMRATKNSLLFLLPAEKKAKAKLYVMENKVSFDREGDLRKLLASL